MFGSVGLFYLSLVSLAYCSVVPTAPGPNEVFKEGQGCNLSWKLDTTDTWKNFTVDLMSGSNIEMNKVTTVFKGEDGTKGRDSYVWPCPKVDPNSAIYFYQFNQEGQMPAWTTRFAIAAKNGTLTAPEHSEQPDGKPIPWGVGKLRVGK